MQPQIPLTKELVLIGGGHTHALVLRRWAMRPLPGARLTLINPDPTAPYTGMLPGFVAGHYAREELSIDLVQLARFAGARLILGAVDGIDRDRRRVHIAGRGEIAFDLASIDIGISSDLPSLPGFAEHAVAAKPLGPYAVRWRAFRSEVAAGNARPEIAVIGAGVGGVELAMAMAHALRVDGQAARITVLDRSTALPGLRPATRRVLLDRMRGLGVELHENVEVTEIDDTAVILESGERIASAFTVGVAGARPYDWLADTGLDLTDGFVSVGATLQSANDPATFAVGDCAYLTHAPRPKAGVYAVREAPVLFDNLRAALTGGVMKPYHPQTDYLKLISLGGKSALADRTGLRAAGRLLWLWKDRIDGAFMDKFRNLTPMAAAPLPDPVADGVREAMDGKPLCAGCGAKLGGAALGRVLAGMPAGTRGDIETRAGDDAAVLNIGGIRQILTTDHLRAFTDDPGLLARIAAIHALGDVWAMGAAPQAALASVILPRMAPALQEAWLAEIMDAAGQVFAAEGAEIVGGHSAMGAELTLGFSVTGLMDGPPITLAGARAGDALILTKPIGTGTVLAGEMQLKARGDWVAACWASMATPQGAAAARLRNAHAMTDVTGFGLAGHLMGMCRASGVSALLSLDAIPFLPGATPLAAEGIRSTLFDDNRLPAAGMTLPADPRAELLFDPQTAGGLLAAVAPDDAGDLVTGLREDGFDAARIGTLTDGPPGITVH